MAEELRFMTELAVAAVWGPCLSLGVGFAIWAAIGWLWNRWMRFSYHFTDTAQTGRGIKPLMGHPKLQISAR